MRLLMPGAPGYLLIQQIKPEMFDRGADMCCDNPQTHGIKRRQLFLKRGEHKCQLGRRRRGEAIIGQCIISHMKLPRQASAAGGRDCAACRFQR